MQRGENKLSVLVKEAGVSLVMSNDSSQRSISMVLGDDKASIFLTEGATENVPFALLIVDETGARLNGLGP